MKTERRPKASRRTAIADFVAQQKADTLLVDILDSLSDGLLAMDHDLIVTYFNSGAERLLGRERRDVLGRNLLEVFPEARGSISEEKYIQAVREKKRTDYETYFDVEPHANWYDVSVYPQASGLTVIFRVATERKEAEEEVSRQKVLSDSIVANTPAGIAFLDNDFVLRRCNPVHAEFIRTHSPYTPEQALGMPYFDCLPGSRPQLEEWFGQVRDTGQVDSRFGFELTLERDRTKETTFWDISVAPVLDAGGKAEGILVLSQEITERRRSERELEDIFNLSADLIAVCTTDGGFLRASPSWGNALGYTIDEILDLGWAKLVHPDDADRTDNMVESQVAGHSVLDYANRFRCRDGTYRKLEWRATPAENGLVYAIARDITEREKAEEALRESEERYR